MTVTTEKTFVDADRYVFDFNYCSHKQGWAHLDTDQDASYHGQWANPSKLQLVSYCEGDVTVTTCTTSDEFRAEINRQAKFYIETLGSTFRIDPLGNKESWEGMGLKHHLH